MSDTDTCQTPNTLSKVSELHSLQSSNKVAYKRCETIVECTFTFQFYFFFVAGFVVSPICVLPLTEENVEKVLDEVRPGLMADGGNVALHEIDGLVVILKLQGACGSCPSSTMTLKMGIETRLRDKIPEILEVEQILDTETGLELTEENVESVCNWNLMHHFLHCHNFICISLPS